jgi:hypothetical protein
MITKLAGLPQFQQNHNFVSASVPQNEMPININAGQPAQSLENPILTSNHHQNGFVNTPRSERSLALSEFDPLKSRIDKVEAELSKIQTGCIRNISFQNLCPFPNVMLPKNFKLPEFKKYSGEGCPMSRLRVYCGDMVSLKSNDQLLIHYFQKSLTSPALK